MIILPSVILSMPAGDDRDYMEWLYREHHRLMFVNAWKFFSDKATVDDVVSESCLSLINKIDTLRSLDDVRLRAYIVSTVRHTALNFIDRQRRDSMNIATKDVETVPASDYELDMESRIILEDELARVWEGIKRLPDKEQQIMRLKYHENLSDAEIADIVGLSASSIQKYISRARDHLKAIIYAE